MTTDSSTYLYGAIGNRLDLSANYDATGTRITFFNNCNYTTDAEGNTIRRITGSASCPAPIDTLVWNAEGQLTRIVLPGGVNAAYYYDAAGRVVRKDSAGAARAYFLWAGDHLLAELNNAATTKTAEYTYYPGMDNPQALIIGQSIYRSRSDGLGNVIALTDSAGVVKRNYGYDDWGLNLGGADGGGFNGRDRVRWKGALWMGPEVDLYFMRSRWYEPATGRFLSEDPIGLAGGTNLFGFAGNDPVNGSDPTGQECWRLSWTEWDQGTMTVTAYTYRFCEGSGGTAAGGSTGPTGVGTPNPMGPGGTENPLGLGEGDVPLASLPRKKSVKPVSTAIRSCIEEHYGAETALQVGLAFLGLPIVTKVRGAGFLGGASARQTVATTLGGNFKMSFRFMGTRRLGAMVGRLSGWATLGFAAYDIASIGRCTAYYYGYDLFL
jgi:RHS repeat-associated protein